MKHATVAFRRLRSGPAGTSTTVVNSVPMNANGTLMNHRHGPNAQKPTNPHEDRRRQPNR